MSPPSKSPLGEPADHPEGPYWQALAVQAMVWAWPLYEMQRMRAATAPRRTVQEGYAGDSATSALRWFNTLSHARQRIRPGGSRVVLPNNDTLYSNAWLDLSDQQAVVVELPAMGDRYHVLGLIDCYTNPFAHIGTRLHGSGGGAFLITPPGWCGEVPREFRQPGRHVPAPTAWVWMIGRLLVDSDDDLPAVTALQDRMAIRSLPDWLAGAPARALRKPVAQGWEQAFHWRHFLQVVNDALAHCPPPACDSERVQAWAGLGLGPGAPAPGTPLRPVIEHAWEVAARQVLPMLDMRFDCLGADEVRAGWTASIMPMADNFGGDYLRRAVIARQAIGAVSPHEAIYPRCDTDADGAPLDGTHAYRMRFAPGSLPPVRAFWSITMYDAYDGMLVENPIDRYAIGDRTPGLHIDADGSLSIHVQHHAPEHPQARANWLPCPAGRFLLCLRAYLPDPAMADGRYVLPPLERCPA